MTALYTLIKNKGTELLWAELKVKTVNPMYQFISSKWLHFFHL